MPTFWETRKTLAVDAKCITLAAVYVCIYVFDNSVSGELKKKSLLKSMALRKKGQSAFLVGRGYLIYEQITECKRVKL